MKKLLAILLAMMLPLGAVAETYSFSFDLQTGGDAFLEFVKAAMMLDGAQETDELDQAAELIQSLLDGAGMTIRVQDDAFAAEVRFSGETLLDLAGYDVGEEVILTSAMIPGYALTAAVEEADEQTDALAQLDWTGVLLSVLPPVVEWCGALESAEAHGVFVGDAYDGGVKCTTWTFDDQDVAALIESLLTEDVRTALYAVFSYMELDAADALQQLEERNAQVAKDNLYTYMLRLVQDTKEQPVGASLTVLMESEQIATVSVGLVENGCRVVAGLGLEQQNYWCETTLQYAAANGAWQTICHTREWAADKEDAFAYVSAAKEPETDCQWRLAAKDGAWELSLLQNDAVILFANGTVDVNAGMLAGKLVLGAENAQLLAFDFEAGPADEIPALNADLVTVSADEPADAEQFENLLNQALATLMARLIKQLPLQMILEMNPFTMP